MPPFEIFLLRKNFSNSEIFFLHLINFLLIFFGPFKSSPFKNIDLANILILFFFSFFNHFDFKNLLSKIFIGSCTISNLYLLK